jgi:hypothetical protein
MSKVLLRREQREGERVTVYEAMRASQYGIAKGKNSRTGKTELVKNTANGIRIIKSVTDPTVVRRLKPAHWAYQAWSPVAPVEGR